MIHITPHAFEKGKERLSLSKPAFEKLATKAHQHGIHYFFAKGKLKKYMGYQFSKHQNANNIRIYGENIFFFDGHVLITVYQVPLEIRKHIKYNKK